MIDIHNHLLIGVDDGPQTDQDALDLLKQAEKNGITDVIVTPHHKSGNFINQKEQILSEMKILEEIIKAHHVNIKVHPGQEIRIYGDLVNDLEGGLNISLNHSNYVLVEFSFTEIPHYIEQLLFDLQMKGYTPIIAHPERYKFLQENPQRLYDFIEQGALAQVTAGAVVGRLGEGLKVKSIEMIKNYLIHIIGSDAHHSLNRPFLLKEAYAVIEEELGSSYVEYLQYNAKAILQNTEVKLKAPIQHKDKITKRKKILGLF